MIICYRKQIFSSIHSFLGLKQLSEVCESFLANIDDVKSREAFGPQLFTAFNNFVDKSVRYSKMYSALELLFLMSNNLSRRHGNPILAFLFWDRVRKSERERDLILSLKLEKAWPFFPSVQLKLADRDKKQDLAKQELRKFR